MSAGISRRLLRRLPGLTPRPRYQPSTSTPLLAGGLCFSTAPRASAQPILVTLLVTTRHPGLDPSPHSCMLTSRLIIHPSFRPPSRNGFSPRRRQSRSCVAQHCVLTLRCTLFFFASLISLNRAREKQKWRLPLNRSAIGGRARLRRIVVTTGLPPQCLERCASLR